MIISGIVFILHVCRLVCTCVSCIWLYRLSAQTVNTTVNVIGPSTKLHLSVGETNIREYVYHNHLMRITKPVAINSVSCVNCTLHNSMGYQDSYILVQILTLTEKIHDIKPAVEVNYSFTDDPEYKKKVQMCCVYVTPLAMYIILFIHFLCKFVG